MDFTMLIGVLIAFAVACLAASVLVYFVSKAKRKESDKEDKVGEYKERIGDLKESLERSHTASQDRREALNNKTKDIFDLQFKNMELEKNLGKEKDRYALLLHQKKSTEVRVGQISEQIAPFLHAWPYKAGRFRFLGSPIDGVSFEDDCVVFMEIKTGKGRLSPSQLRVRKQIREGKVKWVEFRVDPDGIHIKEG